MMILMMMMVMMITILAWVGLVKIWDTLTCLAPGMSRQILFHEIDKDVSVFEWLSHDWSASQACLSSTTSDCSLRMEFSICFYTFSSIMVALSCSPIILRFVGEKPIYHDHMPDNIGTPKPNPGNCVTWAHTMFGTVALWLSLFPGFLGEAIYLAHTPKMSRQSVLYFLILCFVREFY